MPRHGRPAAPVHSAGRPDPASSALSTDRPPRPGKRGWLVSRRTAAGAPRCQPEGRATALVTKAPPFFPYTLSNSSLWNYYRLTKVEKIVEIPYTHHTRGLLQW